MLSVIVPAYNEEKNIPRVKNELIPILHKIGKKYEIIIVDDGSTDNTVKETNKINDKRIRLIKHPKNLGLGSAIRTGIENSKGGFIVTLDSDFTFHPKQIPNLMKKYNKSGADCVIGSPFHKKGEVNTDKFRIFLSKSVNKIYCILLSKRRISSISTIFRLYKSKPLKELKLESKGFEINAEILFKLVQKNRKIVEIPAKLTEREFGESKIKISSEIKNNIFLITKIFFWKIKR